MPRIAKKRLKPAVGLARSVYEQYHNELHRFLMRRSSGGAQAARDLAQEVYLRLLRVEEPELLRNPQGYMYRVASHVIYEYLLKGEQEPLTFNSDKVEQLDANPIELPEDELDAQLSAHKQLRLMLDQLPPTHRAIFILSKRDGFSYKEVAEKLNLSNHTIKKYLFQALAQLRAMRAQQFSGEEWKP